MKEELYKTVECNRHVTGYELLESFESGTVLEFVEYAQKMIQGVKNIEQDLIDELSKKNCINISVYVEEDLSDWGDLSGGFYITGTGYKLRTRKERKRYKNRLKKNLAKTKSAREKKLEKKRKEFEIMKAFFEKEGKKDQETIESLSEKKNPTKQQNLFKQPDNNNTAEAKGKEKNGQKQI